MVELVRIDDYPTGLRRRLKDLTPLHDILKMFDDYRLPVLLGVVPKLIVGDISSEVRGLKHISYAVHGYDHGYEKYMPKLLEAKDPNNSYGTVGSFDEFEGLPTWEVEWRLYEAKSILERHTDSFVPDFIPVGGRINQVTASVLATVGFKRVLCDGAVKGCNLPIVKSDYVGVLRDLDFTKPLPKVICLHLTWEYDCVRADGWSKLEQLLEKLSS